MTTAPQQIIPHISLLQLTRRVEEHLSHPDITNCWVVAEITDFSARGHCYMTLVEKNDKGETVAQMRATIWKFTFNRIRPQFLLTTGQDITNGLKVMFYGSVSFHPVYGISFNITDINPDFTLGEMARRRREILMRLEAEGLIDENKQYSLPPNPQRIAVISSATAAGYGDFIHQLRNNNAGIKFYTTLFAASMQGENTARSIMDALHRIAEVEHLFDCVVIIRGGGSTIDLNWFDDYDMAVAVAQCSLPVITGIGHTRDTSVLDCVAAFPVKTPTAVAALLIDQCTSQLALLDSIGRAIVDRATSIVDTNRRTLITLSSKIPLIAKDISHRQATRLNQIAIGIPVYVGRRINNERNSISSISRNISSIVTKAVEIEKLRLSHIEEKVELLSPQNILKRGYSLTIAHGKIVTDPSMVKPGDKITTKLQHGEISSIITE